MPTSIPSALASIASYGAARFLAYATPSWTPGVKRLKNNLRDKMLEKLTGWGLEIIKDTAIETVGLQKTRMDQKISRITASIGLPDYINDRLIQTGGERDVPQNLSQDIDLEDFDQFWNALNGPGEFVMKLKEGAALKTAIALLAIEKENRGWENVDTIIGLNAFLDNWKISSEHFRGGDTLRSGIKKIAHFLIDAFLFKLNKTSIDRTKSAAQAFLNVFNNQSLDQLLTRVGVENQYFRWGIEGFAGVNALHKVISLSPWFLGAYGATYALAEPYKQTAQGVVLGGSALYTLGSFVASLSPLGFAGIGIGAATLGALYVRHYYPDVWEKLPVRQRPNLDAFVFPQGPSADDAFDPLQDITQLYSIENSKNSKSYQEAFLNQLESVNRLIYLKSKLSRVEAMPIASQTRYEEQQAEIEGLKNEIEECEMSIESKQVVLKSLIEEDPLLKLRLEKNGIQEQRRQLEELKTLGTYLEASKGHVKNRYAEFLTSFNTKQEAIRARIGDSKAELTDAERVSLKESLQEAKSEVEEFLKLVQDPVRKRRYQRLLRGTLKKIEVEIASIEKRISDKEPHLFPAPLRALGNLFISRIRGRSVKINNIGDQLKSIEFSIKACEKICNQIIEGEIDEGRKTIADLDEKLKGKDKIEEEYKQLIAQRVSEAIEKLPVIDEKTLAIDVYQRLLQLAVEVKAGNINIGDSYEVLNKLRSNIDELRNKNLISLSEADMLKKAALDAQYANIFPLGDNARYNNTQRTEAPQENQEIRDEARSESSQLIIDIRATDRVEEMGDTRIESLSGDLEISLKEDFYRMPAQIANGLDARFADELNEENPMPIAIPRGFSLNKKYSSLREEYESLYPPSEGEKSVPPKEKYDEFVKRRLVEITGSAKTAMRVSQVLHKQAAEQFSKDMQQAIITNDTGQFFIPYENGRLLQIADKEPTYSRHFLPMPNGTIVCTLKARWKVIGHVNGPDSIHELDSKKESYYEAYINIDIQPPKQKMGWGKWASDWWGWAKGITDPADFQEAGTNPTIVVSDRAAVAFIEDTLILGERPTASSLTVESE